MKSKVLAIAILVSLQSAWAQEVSPTPAKPTSPDARERSGSDEKSALEARQDANRQRMEAVAQSDKAVRDAAQKQPGSPAPPDGISAQYRVEKPSAKLQKGAWLGLSTSSPPPALRRQLKLPEGTALVVDFVQPKSPAEQGGIKQYDLLLKLNDQLLINAEQLAVLVRTFKPGEDIRLTFLREGDRQTSSMKLVERDLPPLSDYKFQLDMPMQYFNADPKGQQPPANRVTPFGGGGNSGGGVIAPSVQRSERTLTWLDGKRQIIVNIGEDQKSISVVDAQSGKVIYEGPLDFSDRQTRAVSREVRDILDRLRSFLKTQTSEWDSPAKKEQGQ